MNKYSYIKYIHTDDSIITVMGLLNSDLFSNNRVSKKDFLSFQAHGFEVVDNGTPDETLIDTGSFPSNLEMIWSKYDFQEREANKDLYSANDLRLLKRNTVLFIPLTSYNKEVLPIRNKNFLKQNKNIPAFFSSKQMELERDPLYTKSQILPFKSGRVDVQMIELNCQVWIHSKTLDKIIDLSPFISNLNTSKGDIGSFSFTLEPINIIIDRLTEEIRYNFSNIFGTNYVNEYNLFKEGQLNMSFFDKYLQQNDAVFIRFEKLQIESNNVIRHGLEIDKQCLKDQIFDMMGLVDEVASSVNLENSTYVISVNGRDYTKALVEDGQYLIDLIYVQGDQNKFFYGGNPGDKFFKRNFVDNGSFPYLFTTSERKNIYDTLSFIINQMANIGWVSNELFSDYGDDKRVLAYRPSGIQGNDYYTTKEVNGIWQIIKLNIDRNIDDRRILNYTMFDSDGTLMDYFKNICQEPFVEVWGDTYGSAFEFIARQPPTNAEAMREIIINEQYITIETEDTYQINLSWETEYYSWFQFMPSGMDYDSNQFFWGFHFPIIYLEEYVKHFGNHRKVITDKYVPESSWVGGNAQQDANITAQALFNDLKFALEHYSVLPFTRRGQVVISGDRRIKKGSFVWLKATNEICYVNGVHHSLSFSSSSVERATVLEVSRCMVKEFIFGSTAATIRRNREVQRKLKEGYKFEKRDVIVTVDLKINQSYDENFFVSYFDIVNSEVITKELYQRQSTGSGLSNITVPTTNIQTSMTVNPDAFDFFLKRRQFDK